MNNNAYNIVLSFNIEWKNYVKVMLASLLKTNSKNNLNIFIIHHNLNQKFITELNRFVKKYNKNNQLNSIFIDNDTYNNILNTECWPRDTFLRWACFDLLPENTDRCLVLDIDTLIRDDISEYYNQNLDDYFFACCLDMNIAYSDFSTLGVQHIREMSIYNVTRDENYYNCGVTLINLKELRKVTNFKKHMKQLQKYKFNCPDQDILSYIYKTKVKKCDCLLWNYMPNYFFKNIKDCDNFDNAKIIHFAGGNKPWNANIYSNKFGYKEWWHYAWLSGVFFNLALQKYINKIKEIYEKLR